MSPTELSLFQAFRRSLVLVIQAAPIELRYLILLTLISGASSPVALFLNKIIIDEAARLLRQETTANSIALMLREPLLLWTIGCLILLNLLADSMNAVTDLVFASMRDWLYSIDLPRAFSLNPIFNKLTSASKFHQPIVLAIPQTLTVHFRLL